MRGAPSLAAFFVLVPALVFAQVGPLPNGAIAPPGAGAPPATTPPVNATAALRGHVLAGDTGRPLRLAVMRLIALDGGHNGVATTDADGAFEFKELSAGRYNLSASKSPYITLSYGQTRPLEGGTPLNLHDGETIDRLDFTLPRGSVIRGRIVDEYGEPMPNVQVAPMRSRAVNGHRQMMPSGRFATTDDLGEFRVFGLPPGEYDVQATWHKIPSSAGSADDGAGYAPTLFPSTTNVSEAQKVTVGIGTMVSDVVIAMTPIKTARVSGTAVDSRGQPMSGMIVVMHTEEDATTMAAGHPLGTDGSFAIDSLTPGEYTLQAQARPGGGEGAIMKITVSGADLKDLRLIASRASTIAGRILIDPGQTLAPGVLTVMAEPASRSDMMMGFGMGSPGRVSDDSTFALKSGPGTMRLRVVGLPRGWDVRAVRQRGADVTDSGIDVKPGRDVESVDIELTNRLTSILGVVTDARGAIVKDYTVVAFAQDERLWSNAQRYIRMARPDQDGRFTIAALPPGDYCVVALDRLDVGQIGDAEFMNGLRSDAKTFSLAEGEAKSLDLKLSTGS